MNEPWTLQGVSRATWYRRRRHREETVGETETASQAPAPGETAQTETETDGETETAQERAPVPDETAEAETRETVETEVGTAADTAPETVGTDVAGGTAETVPAASETLTAQPPEAPKEDEPWAMSAVEAMRWAARYRESVKRNGPAIADRSLKWSLQDRGVPYTRLQNEFNRIRQRAEAGPEK